MIICVGRHRYMQVLHHCTVNQTGSFRTGPAFKTGQSVNWLIFNIPRQIPSLYIFCNITQSIQTERAYLCLQEQLENIVLGNRELEIFSAETYQVTNHVWILHRDYISTAMLHQRYNTHATLKSTMTNKFIERKQKW